MLRAFSLSIGQLFDPPILRVFAKSLGLTLLVFALLGAGLVYATFAAMASYDWGEAAGVAAATAAAALGVIATWLLFRIVAIAVIGLFGDEIVAAVEARHYPKAAERARNVSFAVSARMGVASAGRAILFNLLASPFYLILLVTGVGTVALVVAVNALLLGRDLGEMVAVRHMPAPAVKDWLARTRAQRAFLGLGVTLLFMIPFANLLAPIFGAAIAAHLFHQEPA